MELPLPSLFTIIVLAGQVLRFPLFEPLYHRSCGAAESIEGLDKKISLQKRVSI